MELKKKLELCWKLLFDHQSFVTTSKALYEQKGSSLSFWYYNTSLLDFNNKKFKSVSALLGSQVLLKKNWNFVSIIAINC